MDSYIQPAFVGRHTGYITDPYLVRSSGRKLLSHDILSHGKGMSGIGGSLEFPLLLTAYAKLSAYPLDPADSYPDIVFRQVTLQFLGAVHLPGPPVCRSDLYLQPAFLPGPLRKGPVPPGIIAAG